MPMTPEVAAKLRAPFPPEQIGKLPKPYKADSPRSNCRECGGYHGLPAVHLDYVGHAAATDRLLQADPEWTWEPYALDQFGLPLLDRDGNLWIRLTVAGVTRPGVGDGKSLKEKIGDAIRNAAMRFGVSLDLWAKEDLSANIGDQPSSTPPEAEVSPEERAERAVTQAQQRRQEKNGRRTGPDNDQAKGRVWDAFTEATDSSATPQAERMAALNAECQRRGWDSIALLHTDRLLELAAYYEEKADDDIRARIARGE